MHFLIFRSNLYRCSIYASRTLKNEFVLLYIPTTVVIALISYLLMQKPSKVKLVILFSCQCKKVNRMTSKKYLKKTTIWISFTYIQCFGNGKQKNNFFHQLTIFYPQRSFFRIFVLSNANICALQRLSPFQIIITNYIIIM